MPAEKQATQDPASTNADAPNMVFLGTSVVSGTGSAEVVATGPGTAFGDIAARLGARPQETAFDRGLRQFSQLLARTVFFLVLFLLVVSIARHRDPLQSLLFAVALAVGLTPEFLPMITSVTLSKGARAMARKKVIVKHLAAIENLGSLDVLCSDKTGTLTAGVMSLDRTLDPFGGPSQRALQLAFLNSKFETGIRSPLDDEILRQPGLTADEYTKCDEIPFDFERRRLSVVVEHGSRRILITKGAAEGIFPLLAGYELDGTTISINDDAINRMKQACDELSTHGFRSIAVAYANVPVQANYSIDNEHNLILAGFLSFADQPLPDAAQVIGRLKFDGIDLKVISGDSDRVTEHVCAQVGLEVGRLVTGQDLDRMTDPALSYVAEQSRVFARVSPAQKNRILMALKHNGHAVGFMGDGINDALDDAQVVQEVLAKAFAGNVGHECVGRLPSTVGRRRPELRNVSRMRAHPLTTKTLRQFWRSTVNASASSIAAIKLPDSAWPEAARSKAVPWSTDVRMIGNPSVTLTALPKPAYLRTGRPWS